MFLAGSSSLTTIFSIFHLISDISFSSFRHLLRAFVLSLLFGGCKFLKPELILDVMSSLIVGRLYVILIFCIRYPCNKRELGMIGISIKILFIKLIFRLTRLPLASYT